MAEEKKAVVTKPHQRYLLIGLMIPQAVDRIIAVLVKRGYTVAPLSSARTAYLSADNNVVTILALEITGHVPEGQDANNFLIEDIKDIIKVTDTKHYMLYLGEPAMCRWSLGNITRDKLEPTNVITPRPGGGLN